MEFTEFVDLEPSAVASLVASHTQEPLGVGIPFNGTRRWYMSTFDQPPEALFTDDYLIQVFRQMRVIMDMMFADGVHTIYTPIMGRDLAERGDEYMEFSLRAIAKIAQGDALDWYQARHIRATCYGDLDLLPDAVQHDLDSMQAATQVPPVKHRLCYGIFGDRPNAQLIAQTIHLYDETGMPPSPEQLVSGYYRGDVARVGLWIGSDQPTVFDVPLVIHGNTALYFLQFPTLYLDRPGWRRLLYDGLFVRGDQETLYPDNIATERHITGLGVRRNGGWMPNRV